MINANEYFYYIHRTPESDYMKFFNKGLVDYDPSFTIESTMEKVNENVLLNGGLQETMKTSLRDGDEYVFLINDKFVVQKEFDGETVVFGTFDDIGEAISFRNLCVKTKWKLN